MAETNEPSSELPTTKANAMALAAEAEAEAAEAEALAAAARARARAAQLKREALALAEDEEYDEYEDDEYEDDEEYEDYDDYVAEDEDAESTEAEDEEPNKPLSWRDRAVKWARIARLSIVVKVAALLIVFGFAGLSAYFVWNHGQVTQRQERAEAFTDGAKTGVVNMTSLDFNKAKEDVQRVIDSSTGEFKEEFQSRAADFTKVVEQSKVVTEGTVHAAAVESMEGHTAVVLISATSHVTNGGDGKQEPRIWRLRVTVTEEDGQYKMSKVEFVP
ncbi:hypothetical protein [Mycobacterium marinum]|uniref:VirB8 protein n=2 Tax=Mycobacterium marinum TaxID=1781 RepID=A0A3E2MVZ0_MYCMR|nr:hypothetical protein [Mycobacterium marinum]MDC8982756.1 hypothetical protein [Mycobacterium marinum]MDC8993481.1 hypothetical protein [Mycobacterium marinum]MDC8999465.1 hypothetical protein [Mycobacterium marinum]MDC9006046.1 hypothetical protein [Mycobacterium marinum]MDC9010072.1 hypothetical protein [Mycobacterium marinum]